MICQVLTRSVNIVNAVSRSMVSASNPICIPRRVSSSVRFPEATLMSIACSVEPDPSRGVVADAECLHPDTGCPDRRHRGCGESGDRVVGFLDGQPHVGQPGEDVQKCEVAEDGWIGRVFRSGTENAHSATDVAGARHCESRSDVCGAGRFVAVVVIQLDRFHSEADRIVDPTGGEGAVARLGE